MKPFVFLAPPAIHFGFGILPRLTPEARRLGISRLLLVTDRGVESAGILDKVLVLLSEGEIEFVVFRDVQPNPTRANVAACAEVLHRESCHGILALGGGSPIDVAKAAGVVATVGGDIRDYELPQGKAVPGPIPPLIAVPTTCGTGSEVTRWSVITDEDRNYKMTVASPYLIPIVALVDAELMLTLPPTLIAQTALDALTHAIEAYTNSEAQPITDALCLQAISLIAQNIVKAVRTRDRNALAHLALASTIAGLCNSNNRAGLIHAMGHPLSAHVGIHHGLAISILLPHVIEFNLEEAAERYRSVALAMGIEASPVPLEAGRQLVQHLHKLERNVGIPPTLEGVGITPETVELMTLDTFKSGNVKLNPRQPSAGDVKAIYMRLLPANQSP